MAANTGIGGNNPPEEKRIEMLTPAEDIQILVGKDVTELTEQASNLLDTYGRVPDKVESDEIYDKVVALVAAMRQTEADRDEKRKRHKQPYLDAGTAVDKAFNLPDSEGNECRKKLDAAIKNLTDRLSVYDTANYQAEQAQAAKEAEELAEKAKSDGIEIDTSKVEVKLDSRKSEHGGMSTRSVVKEWTVTDEDALPRSVLSVDPKKVQALVDKGAKIPGIEITERVATVVKRK